MSNNGLARTNHCRKHVREGRMSERREYEANSIYYALRFDIVKKTK